MTQPEILSQNCKSKRRETLKPKQSKQTKTNKTKKKPSVYGISKERTNISVYSATWVKTQTYLKPVHAHSMSSVYLSVRYKKKPSLLHIPWQCIKQKKNDIPLLRQWFVTWSSYKKCCKGWRLYGRPLSYVSLHFTTNGFILYSTLCIKLNVDRQNICYWQKIHLCTYKDKCMKHFKTYTLQHMKEILMIKN